MVDIKTEWTTSIAWAINNISKVLHMCIYVSFPFKMDS